MYHTIMPVFNGYFSVRFEGQGGSALRAVENIPSFVFLVVDEDGGAVLVDTGFARDHIPGLGSTFERSPEEELPQMLAARGFDAAAVKNVVQTHIHWDHTGGMKHLTAARFFIQYYDFMQLLHLNPNEETYYCPAHWLPALPRVEIVHGVHELKPGLTLIPTGGHTHGHQAVRVNTRQGTVVLAGDAPFNYDMLWKAVPAEYWKMYREGAGARFYWNADVLPFIEKWIADRGLDVAYEHRPVPWKEIQKMGDRVIFSHDGSLREIASIP